MTYPEKFIRDNGIAPFLLLCVVIVNLLAAWLSGKNVGLWLADFS